MSIRNFLTIFCASLTEKECKIVTKSSVSSRRILTRSFVRRAESGGGVHVADVSAGDEAGHSDAGRSAGRRHLTSYAAQLPPKPPPKRLKAPLLYLRGSRVWQTLWSLQVTI